MTLLDKASAVLLDAKVEFGLGSEGDQYSYQCRRLGDKFRVWVKKSDLPTCVKNNIEKIALVVAMLLGGLAGFFAGGLLPIPGLNFVAAGAGAIAGAIGARQFFPGASLRDIVKDIKNKV